MTTDPARGPPDHAGVTDDETNSNRARALERDETMHDTINLTRLNLELTPDLAHAILEAMGCYDIEATRRDDDLPITLTYRWTLRDGQGWPLTVHLGGHCDGIGSLAMSVERALRRDAERVEISRLIHAAAPEIPREVVEEVLIRERHAREALWNLAGDDFDDVPF